MRWPQAVVGAALAAGLGSAQAQVRTATAPAPAAVRVGAAAPDFRLAASDGTVRRLADLAGKKSLVLVFFRGVW
jgi:cytochrome oxidase Cu insertion factor (SCO1/SenC/PrrC family)